MVISDGIAHFLESRGVQVVFEMSGGMITRILDSIYRLADIRIVSMHHEQAAAFAADAVGRITGVPGVAMATSGPGAINLLTGIGSCYFDSAPAVFITGQVNRNEMKGSRDVRQLGFQETDIVTMAQPITKAAWLVREPDDVMTLLARAFDLAVEGRPGPVLVDIPMDVQAAPYELPSPLPPIIRERPPVPESFWPDFHAALNRSARPLAIVGGGVNAAHAASEMREFLRASRLPACLSLLGIDVLGFDDPLRVGMIGSYGNRWTNLAAGRADFLLVLGSRLDIRQTGSDTQAFAEGKVIFHVDCDPGEIGNRVPATGVVCDVRDFLAAGRKHAVSDGGEAREAWLREISSLKSRWPDTAELAGIPGINPNEFMHRLGRASGRAGAFVVDVGQHQMWGGQSLEINQGQRFLTSGGMGSMGYGLPAGIGVALTNPRLPVVVIAGDGGFQSNIQELQTVVRNELPMKLVVLNNQSHGMVRQFQESYFESRFQSTVWGYSAPDFATVASAYGVPGRTIDSPDEIDAAIEWLWSEPDEARLLQVMISPKANAYPKIAFGRPITEMEPFAKPTEVEGA